MTFTQNERENKVEKHLVDEVEALGGWCLKWVSPGRSGVPDRIVLLPGARIYFVELKRPKGGKLSALQKKWQQRLNTLGFKAYVLWSREEVDEFIKYVKEK